MFKIFDYAEGYKSKIFLALVFILCSVIFGIIPYFLINNLLVQIIDTNTLVNDYLMKISLIITLMLIVKAVFYGIGITLSHIGAYGILFNIRKKFADNLIKQPLGTVINNGTGRYKKKFSEDIGKLELVLAHLIPEGISYFFIPFLVIIVLFTKDWRMGLLSMGSIPFGIIPMMLMMGSGIKKMPIYYAASDRLNNTIIEYISGMEVIKIFNQTSSSYEKYTSSVMYFKKYALAWVKDSLKYMAVVSVVLPCTIILTLPIGLLMYYNGTLSLDTLVFTLLLNLGIGVPLNKGLLFLPSIPQLSFTLRDLESIFDSPQVKVGNYSDSPKNKDISFENVTFRYEKEKVLDDVSFTLKENSFTALVGPSGGGKSTIAKLLVHYWDVENGSIKIGGHDISEFTQENLMNEISYVSQDNFLFDLSICENIKIGNPNATNEMVVEAAKKASCHEFILDLPHGYDSMVGSLGGNLSGGERQRITIARAFLKDSPIIVLDEATAFTDAENEDLIQSAINNLMKEKTVIVVAHRLGTIVNADNILVIDKGKIAAQGTHNSLLKSSLLYKKLWDSNQRINSWHLDV